MVTFPTGVKLVISLDSNLFDELIRIIQSCSKFRPLFGWQEISKPALIWKIFRLSWMTFKNSLFFDTSCTQFKALFWQTSPPKNLRGQFEVKYEFIGGVLNYILIRSGKNNFREVFVSKKISKNSNKIIVAIFHWVPQFFFFVFLFTAIDKV